MYILGYLKEHNNVDAKSDFDFFLHVKISKQCLHLNQKKGFITCLMYILQDAEQSPVKHKISPNI